MRVPANDVIDFYAKHLNWITFEVLIFESKPVIHSVPGISFSNAFFDSAIRSMRMRIPEEILATDVVQRHLGENGSFHSIVKCFGEGNQWTVVTEQFQKQTRYHIDTAKSVIVNSEFKI